MFRFRVLGLSYDFLKGSLKIFIFTIVFHERLKAMFFKGFQCSDITHFCVPLLRPIFASHLCVPPLRPTFASHFCVPPLRPTFASQLCVPGPGFPVCRLEKPLETCLQREFNVAVIFLWLPSASTKKGRRLRPIVEFDC